MLKHSRRLCIVVCALFFLTSLRAQSTGPTSGEVTVRLVEGMDSSTDPKAVSHGQVLNSTNPAVPRGSAVLVGLGSDPINGGYTAKVLQMTIGGRIVPVASSTAVLAPDAIGKLQGWTRAKGQPKDSIAGNRVFLPKETIVRFTLAELPAPPPPPPPPPNVWNIAPWPSYNGSLSGTGAAIFGTAASGGKRGRSQLQIVCATDHSAYWTLLFVSPALMDFTVNDLAIADENGTQLGLVSIGDGQETRFTVGAETDPQARRLSLTVHPPEALFVGQDAGKDLRIRVVPPNGKGNALEATFTLPTDQSPMTTMVSPCVEVGKHQAAEMEKSVADQKAKIVLSCPTKPGKTLTEVKLKISPGGKYVDPDDGDDTSTQWKLKRLKPGQHALLECGYKPSSPTAKGATIGNLVTLPVPANAVSCDVGQDMQQQNVTGDCSKK